MGTCCPFACQGQAATQKRESNSLDWARKYWFEHASLRFEQLDKIVLSTEHLPELEGKDLNCSAGSEGCEGSDQLILFAEKLSETVLRHLVNWNAVAHSSSDTISTKVCPRVRTGNERTATYREEFRLY